MSVHKQNPSCHIVAVEQCHQLNYLEQNTQQYRSVKGAAGGKPANDMHLLSAGFGYKRNALPKSGAQYYCECKEYNSQLNEQNNLVGHNHV